MLCVDKATLIPFGEEELQVLIKSKSWESMLPSALGDEQLLQLSYQLRDLLSGRALDAGGGKGSAALPMTLLLLSKAGATHHDLMTDMDMVHEVMMLLSIAADREIVNRMIQNRDRFTGADLMETLKGIVQLKHSSDEALSLA